MLNLQWPMTLNAKFWIIGDYWSNSCKDLDHQGRIQFFVDQTPLTCKYVIARRRSPCEIELNVDRAYNTGSEFYNVDVKNLILTQGTQILNQPPSKLVAVTCVPLAPGRVLLLGKCAVHG